MTHDPDEMRVRVERRRDHGPRGRRRSATPAAVRSTNNDRPAGTRERRKARLPLVVYMLALGTFLMGTTEFTAAGVLPEIAGDLHVSVARAGLSITVFAAGMIVGAPVMTMLARRLPRRLTLVLALGVFACGHVFAGLHRPSACCSPRGS